MKFSQIPGIRKVVQEIVSSFDDAQDRTVDDWLGEFDTDADPMRELVLWIGISRTFVDLVHTCSDFRTRNALYQRLAQATIYEGDSAAAMTIQRHALNAIEDTLKPLVAGIARKT